MARWGRCDFKQFEALRDRLEKMNNANIDKFCEDCAKELAARLLGKVIRRTPVGQYPKSTGMLGGTLRRGWTANSQREAELTAVFGGGSSGAKYANSLKVVRTGNFYTVILVNPVHYAAYVEFGHRTKNHKGWVQGRFMMTISVQELEAQAPAIIERKLIKFLGGVFDGK